MALNQSISAALVAGAGDAGDKLSGADAAETLGVMLENAASRRSK